MGGDLKETLRRESEALGFDIFGVAPAGPAETGDFFARWIGEGYHGGMEYLARRASERRDVGKVLPGARAIICVGVNYNGRAPGTSGLMGRVARYAWGKDYHRSMGGKLKVLSRIIKDRSGGRARWYVDTGPVLEREYAVRAGMGWFGKSTNLIREEVGSYVLLGEILTDVPLAPDRAVAERCGSCTACIDACPTGAIREPYLLDSNACIAYLTIEHRGAIRQRHRAAMGDWVFGCDVCQEVCPWNRRAPVVREPDETASPDLVSLLEMSEHTWQERFQGSAVRRAGWQGIRRNAAIALGNSDDPAAVPALRRALVDGDPVVREHVTWALGRLGEGS